MCSTQQFFVTVLCFDLTYALEILLHRNSVETVTYLTRHGPEAVTVFATRPLDLARFFVEFRLSL